MISPNAPDTIMQLPELKLLFLTFQLEAQESVVLPPFLGSTLRGAFGTALKEVFCFVPHGECERCWFFEPCPYQYIFESPNSIPKTENHPLLRGQREIPHPFVLIPPIPVRKEAEKTGSLDKYPRNFNEAYAGNHFSRGEKLEFSIMLIGRAAGYWAQTLAAVRLLAANGLGEKRVPFTLTNAFAHDSQGISREVFNPENPQIKAFGVEPVLLAHIIDLRLQSFQDKIADEKKNSLKLEFLTPTRLRIGNEINQTITFFDLFRKITERLEFMAFLHAENRQRIDYRPLLSSAENVSSGEKRLELYQFEQFSNAQNRKTRREAVLGSINFSLENLNQILPFLLTGELFNAGADTSYGFGKIIFSVN